MASTNTTTTLCRNPVADVIAFRAPRYGLENAVIGAIKEGCYTSVDIAARLEKPRNLVSVVLVHLGEKGLIWKDGRVQNRKPMGRRKLIRWKLRPRRG